MRAATESSDHSPATELRDWVKDLGLDPTRAAELLRRIEQVVAHQRALVEASKHEAICALSEGFAGELERLRRQLSEKDATVSTISRYFEEVVADLTEKSHRDPKTKLLNFDWFMARVESYLAIEQRVRWCGVGVVDINRFKWFNDTLGHAVGDRIIDGVARILAERIRSAGDLHARFGGDEFCFLISDLPGCDQAGEIAGRFKRAVEEHDWSQEDPRLTGQIVRVDVGVVCLRLGAVQARRAAARPLAAGLVARADALMYAAKGNSSTHVHMASVEVRDGELDEIPE